MFAATIPKKVTQDMEGGSNDLYAAKVTRFAYAIDNQLFSEGYDENWIADFEELVLERVGAWNAKSKLLNVQTFTYDTW